MTEITRLDIEALGYPNTIIAVEVKFYMKRASARNEEYLLDKLSDDVINALCARFRKGLVECSTITGDKDQ